MANIKVDISVIVLTYNPDYEKLFNTLKTIIMQKNCNLEIIISDDGSKEFDQELVSGWLKENNFNDYRIVANPVNKGTVINICVGMKLAKGKYIKLISPGDYLYSDNVLCNMLNYMKKNDYKIAFGRAVYYSIDDNAISITKRTNPMNLKPYINYDFNKIKKDYLYYQDYILGSSVICESSLFHEYIEKIIDLVKYAEDRVYIMMIADGIKIHFWNNYLLWYECNTGVSTSNPDKYSKQLALENSECFKLIAKEHPEYERTCKIHYFENYNMQFTFRLKRKFRTLLLKLKNIQPYEINKLKQIINK